MSKYFTLASINPLQDTIVYNNAIKRSVDAGVISIIPDYSKLPKVKFPKILMK